MFKWLFGKKKTKIKVTPEVKVSGNRNTVQSVLVGKPTYSNYRADNYVYGFSTNDAYSELSNPVKPKLTSADVTSNSHDNYASPSYGSGSSSYDSGSSSYDSGSSSCDSGSSSFSSCD